MTRQITTWTAALVFAMAFGCQTTKKCPICPVHPCAQFDLVDQDGNPPGDGVIGIPDVGALKRSGLPFDNQLLSVCFGLSVK